MLGCGVISWRPPLGNEGQQLGYVVRFFDGETFETTTGYKITQRYFEDIGRQWAVAENLPTDGRTVYADVSYTHTFASACTAYYTVQCYHSVELYNRFEQWNTADRNSPFSTKIIVAGI